MKTTMRLTAIAIAASLLCPLQREARACSTFVMRDGRRIVYGRNFDFFLNGGYVMTNRRGVSKTALAGASQTPARWVSKYGSVTFNQASQEFPYGGMNEAGLVVENMTLQATKYPTPDARGALFELQWIQYQLDNHATVAEVLASDSRVRIEPDSQPLHFLVADRGGDVATIEFLGGKLVAHTGANLSVTALTNSRYDESLAYLARHQGLGGQRPIVTTPDSLDRFATIATGLREPAGPGESEERRAFEILEAVAGRETVWSVVYDLTEGRVAFKSRGNRHVRTFRLGDLRFDCAAPSRALAVDAPGEADVARDFQEYTTEMNRALVRSTFTRYREAQFVDVPDVEQETVARYPATTECATGR